jgi:hypothetical protein
MNGRRASAFWTFESNVRAQRFYERQGFVAARRTDGRDNEEGAPDILFVWRGHSGGESTRHDGAS